MALRAFQSNPSIGGFGGESHFGGLHSQSQFGLSQSQIRDKRRESKEAKPHGSTGTSNKAERRLAQGDVESAGNVDGQFGTGSCDAFAQIVKELVDNAVDACAPAIIDDLKRMNEDATIHEKKTMKRVRVDITSAPVPVPLRENAATNDEDSDASDCADNAKTMDCLRVVISDNGCGMENIDDCVTAFRSNKNGAAKKQSESNGNKKGGNQVGGRSSESVQQGQSKSKNKKEGGKTKQTLTQQQPSSSDNNEKYTSGRYGVGLTLCLLHAQRLVPGTGACITSATASASKWTRAIFEPDTDADDIVCKKKEHFPKEVDDECGTTISLYVPGGEEAKRAWPRLAEYFARFQLSIDLPCSLEVKAPSLQSRPLYVRPPAEIERRMLRKRYKSLAAEALLGESDAYSDSDESSIKHNWDGDDCFDEGIHSPLNGEKKNQQQPKTTSKAARERAEAELRTNKSISLLHKAASTFKCRLDLKIENVAYTLQPIRKTGSNQSALSKNGPFLEVGFVVFGPKPYDGSESDDSDDIERGNNVRGKCDKGRSNGKNSATLQVVRMVNGIPLLDSSEALACGVVQKISNNSTTWNSFGLEVQKSNNHIDPTVPLNERNTPTFGIDDSAQVAPFLKSTAHSIFEDPSQDHDESSSDEDGFDEENMRRGKRKKERKVRCVLPAALRLGDVLMIVQIRAKPSSLPLPTLSKGRLPLNDKGISDALENGISDCLRHLQRSSPGLLLTAHQLKRVERDVRYTPSIAGAIASVLCRSKQSGVHDNAISMASGWNDEIKRMGNKQTRKDRRRRPQSDIAERSIIPTISHVNEEKLRADVLCPMLERRLRFVVSDEFKDTKKVEEKEKLRLEREEVAVAKKKTKKKKAVESDGMKGDCFDSDGGGNSDKSSMASSESSKCMSPEKSKRDIFHDDIDSDMSSPHVSMRIRLRNRDSISSSDNSSVAESGRDENINNLSQDSFGSDPSCPVVHTGCQDWKKDSVKSSENSSSEECPQSTHKSSSCDDVDDDLNNPIIGHKGHHHWQQRPASSSQQQRFGDLQKDESPQNSSQDEFDSNLGSPIEQTEGSGWEENDGNNFGDGYESSPRLHNDVRNIAANVQNQNDKFRQEESSKNGGFGSEGILYAHEQEKSTKQQDDYMSVDSEWSAQYGDVVPGHLFH